MSESHYLDTKGLICPEPVMLLHRAIRKIVTGDLLIVESTDPSSMRDIPKFCVHLGHELCVQKEIMQKVDEPTQNVVTKTIYHFEIRKG